MLFGDGAGACILNSDPENALARVQDSICKSDGSLHDLIIVGGGTSCQYKPGDPVGDDFFISMQGREVYKHAVRQMSGICQELLERNGQLESQVLDLQDQLDAFMADTVLFKGFAADSTERFPYSFVVAQVVNNSVVHLSNYITVNKGRKDGITPDMGVVSERGVVGIVSTVSDHFSVIIPLLNPKLRLSCKVLGSSYFGSLSWNGHNTRYATLEELPRHVEFQRGDTIVTSGYSAVFPAGLIVGIVEDYEKQHDDNFYALQVRLATDFQALNHVRIIKNFLQQEQLEVEKEAKKND